MHKVTGLALVRLKVRGAVHSIVSHVRHPKGATCLECGFLAFGDSEMVKNNRILLSLKGIAGSPELRQVQCFRSLWDFDARDDANGIFRELEKKRRPCEGFFRFIPGYSPIEHRALMEKRQDRREKVVIGILGGLAGVALTLLTAWLRKNLRLGQ